MMRQDIALRARPNESLSLEEMRQRLPSIFATEPHESRSDRYVFVSTHDMVHHLIQRDFLPVEARVSRTRDINRRAYAKHMIRFRHAGDLTGGGERKVGDTSFEVIMRNAHDGTGSYQFMAGLLRLVCLNGMVVSDGTVSEVKVLHSGSRQRQLERVVEGAFTVLDQGPRVIEKVKEWKTIDMTPAEQGLYASAAHAVRFPEDSPIEARQLLHPRRYQDAGSDLWSTFNRVQENAVRGGLTGLGRDANNRPRRSTSREVRGIDNDLKLNKALWILTEQFAALKTGTNQEEVA